MESGPPDDATLKFWANDALYVTKHPGGREQVREACALGDQLTDYIFSMANFRKKDESVDLRQGTFKTTPLEDLCAIVLNSSEIQWRMQPHYFGAIILEMNARLQMVEKVTGDTNIPKFRD